MTLRKMCEEKIIADTEWSVRDARGKLTHYKIIHRYYYTPVRLHKMGLIQNNLCWKCKAQAGTFLHSMWECSLVSPFWKEVIEKLGEWLGKALPESPQLCLMGDRSRLTPGISRAEFGLALTGFITAARIILRHWKSQIRPEFTEWVKLMTDNASYELMIARLNDNKGKFYQVWGQFLNHIRGE